MSEETANVRLTTTLGCFVLHYNDHSDGFSFTVPSELEAYRCAYKYQPHKTVVREAPNVGRWLVHVRLTGFGFDLHRERIAKEATK